MKKVRLILIVKLQTYIADHVHSTFTKVPADRFDDFTITHIKKREVRHINHYYPFGLTMDGAVNQPNTQNPTPNTRLFNAGSELQELSNLYDTYYRQYDASLGRFNAIDPKASMFKSWSPYSFGFNDPVYWNDPLGDCPDCWDAEAYIKHHPGYFYSAHHADSHMSTGRERMNRYTGPGSGYYWADGLHINPKNGRRGRWVNENHVSKEWVNGEYVYVVYVTSTFYEFEGNLNDKSNQNNISYDQPFGFYQHTDGPFGVPVSPYNTTSKHGQGINVDMATGVGPGNGASGASWWAKWFSNLWSSSSSTGSLWDYLFGDDTNEGDSNDSQENDIEDQFKDTGSKEDKATIDDLEGSWYGNETFGDSIEQFHSSSLDSSVYRHLSNPAVYFGLDSALKIREMNNLQGSNSN